ncbi:MAG: FecR domain-containing protein [Proteobacteria bacterium]|nr:FecR domain-containing protein [Pseudomonadota bacterium]
MKLHGRIPVEPLDDERLTNIERAVVSGAADRLGSPVRASRFSVGFAAGLVGVVAAAGVVGWMLHRAPSAPGATEAGRVAIATGPRASVLDIGDASIESAPGTTYVVTRPDGGVLVDMQRGKLELEVGKRGGRPPLVVRAGETDVIVVGTHFTVDYGDGHGDPTVAVTEGVVRVVRRHAEAARIAAGHAWTPTGGLVALAPVAQVTPVPTPTPIPENGLQIDTTHTTDLRTHVAAVPDARIASTQPTHPTSVLGNGPEVSQRPRTLDAATDPHLDLKTMIRQEAVAAPVDVHEVDAAGAVSRYYDMLLAKRDPQSESRAYYGIAYMQHLRLGRNGDAQATRIVVIDAASARDLAAGGAFVSERDLAIYDECELVVRATSGELRLPARVVYVDPARGAGLEVIGFSPAIRDQLAALLVVAPAAAVDDAADADGEAADTAEAEADAADALEKDPAKRTMHARLRGLNLAAQVKLARDGDVQERILLERLYGKHVWEPLLRNPRLTAPEVARISKMGALPRILLEIILGNGGWLQMPDVRRALLTNPRLGADQIVKILRMMPKPELRLVPTQTMLPHAVRETARRLLRGEG